MEYIEVTGKSVEEAITNACTKLGIPSDKLDYEVIDKGNSGFLGIFNSKPAKIKAREKQEEPEVNSGSSCFSLALILAGLELNIPKNPELPLSITS